MGIWIFGIRLFLTEAIKEAKSSVFNYDIIQTFLSNANGKPHKMAHMAKKIFEYYDKQETMIKKQLCQRSLESLDSDLEHLTAKTKIGERVNEKIYSNDETDYRKSNFPGPQNEIVTKDHENCDNSNYKEDDNQLNADIRTYIDNKFHDMEKRLMIRINEMEANINQQFDIILNKFETQSSIK